MTGDRVGSWKLRATAVFATFALNGMLLGSWSGRVPTLAAQVHAGPGGLGLALLGGSVGLISSAVFAGRICVAVGARVAAVIGAVSCCLILTLLGLATSIPVFGGVMFLLQACAALLDISMNVLAVEVVRALNRPLMPVFHAAFSLGGLAGALGASAAAHLNWSPLRHFAVVAVVGIGVTAALGWALPRTRQAGPAPAKDAGHADRRPLLRRRLLWLLAGIALCSAVAEGCCSDWSALFLVRERGLAPATAATGYAAFSIAMAISRLCGENWERRWGPHRLVIVGGLLAATGFFAAALVPSWLVGYAGFVLAGAGLAFSFPVALGLAGAAGRRADGAGGELEISFVTTIAYTGFMAGPPLIGFVAQATNLAVALGMVGVIAAVMVPAASAARKARQRESATRAYAS